MKKSKKGYVWRAAKSYLIFFSLVSFVTTCSMLLFLSIFSSVSGITLSGENLEVAAKLTFINVILISLIFTVIDAVRRKISLERPVEKITHAAQRMIEGDFSARISDADALGADENFQEIIDCINKMAEEFSGVETLRSDFVANVSHEMKTPLAAIQNYAALLNSSELSEEERKEYSKAISRSAERLSSMMTNILKLNRLENQQIYVNKTSFDLSEQLCEALLTFESVWEAKGIEIETDIDENITVFADFELLLLIWNNLLSNAFKFSEKGDTVSVSLKTDDQDSITVVVSDTGCGMSQEIGEHIFEKFYQGDPSRATEGNGLGLPLVKRVLDIVGGEIKVESKLGEGSRFAVKLRRN